MFGYVKAHAPELRMAEYEYYRGTYCGLCRAMGKCTGQCSRLALSYDFAFLALVKLALSRQEVTFKQKRCLAHPLKKRNSMEANAVLCNSAYSAALLSYHKLKDDISDEKGLKRLFAYLLILPARRMRKKALKQDGFKTLDLSISEHLKKLSVYEATNGESVDTPAEIFGALLSDIVSFGYEGIEERLAKNIGYHIGKWIYIVDALDDLSDDLKKDRYNPFAKMYKRELDDRELSMVADALKNELASAEAAFDLIDYGNNYRLSETIKNIIYLGMPNVVDKIIKNEDCLKKGHFEIDERSL
jgi:hypothetical protein